MRLKNMFLLAILAILMTAPQLSASVIVYFAILDGPSPPVEHLHNGFATVAFDTLAQTMEVQVVYFSLLGQATSSQIDCCTASPGTGTAIVATTLPLFPLGHFSDPSYDHIFDLTLSSSYDPAFVAAHGGTAATAEGALLAGIATGEAYLNIETTFAPDGEIGGFLVPAPEPAAWGLVGLALTGLVVFGRKRRISA